MTYALLALAAFICLLYAVSMDRARANNALIAQRYMDHLQVTVDTYTKEVAMLCQRIQAPEAAVMQHQMTTAGEPEYGLPLSDVESARAEERAQVIREIELMEQANA